MSDIWFTSDLHFGHSNIVVGTSTWEDKTRCRNFKTVEEHNEVLIDFINSNVKQGDILYHLGDWSFGGKDNVIKYRNRLYVETIHVTLGNHDHHIAKVGTDEYKAFTTVQKTIDLEGRNPMFMSHYKHAIWAKSHKGVIHLYGHSHGEAEHMIIGKSMDVGIENAIKLLGEPRPFHMDEILWLMSKRNIQVIDHHNPKDKNS